MPAKMKYNIDFKTSTLQGSLLCYRKRIKKPQRLQPEHFVWLHSIIN